jgi:chromosome segregation ATPase
MHDAEDAPVDPALGSDVEDAVDVVRDREPEADRESVRSALELVAEDGVVSRAGIDSALADASKHVATPETRLELAGNALDSARETAEPVADIDVVDARLDQFEARYEAIESDVDELASQLDRLVERRSDPEDVYDLSRSITALKRDARDAQTSADRLSSELEEFEAWVSDAGVRFEELDADAGHVEGLLDDLSETIDELESTAAETDEARETADAGTARGTTEAAGDDLALAWADAALRRRVLGLLVSDLRAELSALGDWADREEGATTQDGEIERRIDDLQSREAALGERLETIASPAWRDRFGARIEAAEADLDSFDPPVQWGALQAVLEEHRSALAERR